MHEYEHIVGEAGKMAVTLLRASGKIISFSEGDTWKIPGNQCKMEIKLNMAIYPYSGNYLDVKASAKAKEFQTSLLCHFQPVDVRKFSGGRPAVQDTEIKEIFYRQDPFKQLCLPMDCRFIEFNGKDIVLSALKKSEKDDGTVLRVYNVAGETREFSFKYFKSLTYARRMNLKEELIEELNFAGNRLDKISLKPKQILTITLK